MSWFTPIVLTHDERSVSAPAAARSFGVVAGGGLGSATAGSQWAWAETPATTPVTTPARAAVAPPVRVAARDISCVRAPAELLSRMSAMARAQGRSESDVWVEAAREWLRRREIEPVTPPAAPTSTRGVTSRRPARVWDEIDALMIDLRMPSAQLEREGAPAA